MRASGCSPPATRGAIRRRRSGPNRLGNVVVAGGLATPGRLADEGLLAGYGEAVSVLAEFTPEAVVGITGIGAATTRDLVRLGLAEGDPAVVSSRVGSVTAPVELTDGILPGVVSLPHRWGHGQPDTRMRIAAEHAGVNSNILTDEQSVDAVTGNAVLNGIPVSLQRG